MKEFDYAQAWHGLAFPAVAAFTPAQQKLCANLAPMVLDSKQDSNCNLPLPVPANDPLFALSEKELAEVSRAAYFFGHWKPGKLPPGMTARYKDIAPWLSEQSGVSWRISNVLDVVLRVRMAKQLQERGCLQIHNGQLRVTFSSRDCWTWREFGLATPENIEKFRACNLPFGERNLERSAAKLAEICGDMWDTSPYMVHKPGTEFNDDEVAEVLASFGVVKIIPCNYKAPAREPHPFVIGPAHMKGDSMYIRPESAPCAHCRGSYSQHTNERAAVLKSESDANGDTLNQINAAITDFNQKHAEAKIAQVQHVAVVGKASV